MRKRDREAAAKLLDKAADLLSEPGRWTRFRCSRTNWRNGVESYCAIGAINKAAGEEPDEYLPHSQSMPSRMRGAFDALGLVIDPTQAIPIARYNDDEAADKRYVIRKMRKAARLLREGELL